MKTGDIVILNSGGPAMTISYIDVRESGTYARCEWITDDGKVNSREFPIECLFTGERE